MPNLLSSVRAAASRLSPHEVVEKAERPIAVALVATSSSGYADMEDFLVPPTSRRSGAGTCSRSFIATATPAIPTDSTWCCTNRACPVPINAFTFFRDDPERTINEILKERHDLALPLARRFEVFRKPVIDRVIHSVARENALFAVATALPNVVPSLLELPWAVGEFASDTAFLTINQIRMAFLIGAASDREVGYLEQKGQIATIVGSAFGWRTLARELVGKIPLGGGLIPKGAIAYAGTYVVGKGLERINRFGGSYSSSERREHFDSAFERGKAVVEMLLAGLKNHKLAKG